MNVKDHIVKMPISDLLDMLGDLNMECEAGPIYNSTVWCEIKRRLISSPNPIDLMYEMVDRFNRDIVGLPIPKEPQRLSPARKSWALAALFEELTEFRDAEDIDGEADALIDSMYFALGRLVEMGIAPLATFQEVHAANMRKRRGELSKRPNSMGYDAIKPEGWTGPDLAPYLTITRDQILEVIGDVVPVSSAPKLLILGYARHGKDTVCDILKGDYGLNFTSSSMFCAEHVMMPYFNSIPLGHHYCTAEECFADRHNFRAQWFEQIAKYNDPDGARLAREMLVENDIYCGMRSAVELGACGEERLFDHIIWVDRSLHLPREDSSSCTVQPYMADHILNNNGTIEDLHMNLYDLLLELGVIQ